MFSASRIITSKVAGVCFCLKIFGKKKFIFNIILLYVYFFVLVSFAVKVLINQVNNDTGSLSKDTVVTCILH